MYFVQLPPCLGLHAPSNYAALQWVAAKVEYVLLRKDVQRM